MTRRVSKRRRWQRDEDRLVRDFFPNTRTDVLAKALKRTPGAVYMRAQILGVKKSAAYLASPDACRLRRGNHGGVKFRFQKGHVPANKGLRRPGWHRGRMRETQFKKGTTPKTWVPIGTEVCDRDGYLKRKVTDDRTIPSRFNWRYVHRLLWEQHHGHIPKGFAVKFKNGDRTDVRIENLELISLRDNMRRNSIHTVLPPEYRAVAQLRGALTRQINKRERRDEEHRPGPAQPPVRPARGAPRRQDARGGRARGQEGQSRQRNQQAAGRPGQG